MRMLASPKTEIQSTSLGEIAKFAAKATQRGFTLVPLRLYFKQGRAKVELAVAQGKKTHDKRQDQKKAEAQREIRKAMHRKP